jgi:glycosyltransferase involved in cell wall biosynthesis
MKRLLTIGHSYVVAANRELAHQMALAGAGEWEVTAVAPARYRGDLRAIAAEPIEGEASTLETLPVRLDAVPHLMWYEKVRPLLARGWDVVHCWEEPYVFAGAQIARATPAPAKLVVATFQNLAKDYPWPLSGFERATMTRADGWIAFGSTVRDVLAPREAYAARPCRVIPPGVDVRRFAPDPEAARRVRARLGWPATACVVGYLGRFVEQKGLRLLMNALDACQGEWHALFVGGGPLELKLRAFAAAHPGRVHIQTGVPHDGVPEWLNAMSMLAAPSQTTARWREQFGRMLIEAMACGVPVIASDSGEMPFVVGDAGAIVPEADVTAWTAALDRLLADEALRRDLAARGLARARQYAWPVVARAHLEFFETLLSEARP